MSEWKPYTAVGTGVKVGLYDTRDNVWLGDDKGPTIFDQETLEQAQLNEVHAEVAGAQLGCSMARIRVKEWLPAYVRLRDHVDVKMGAEEALERLEAGYN